MASRLQFSLKSLLLFAITIGALVGFFFARHENSKLREENTKLRDELGVLDIADPTKAWARTVPTDDSERNRFRIYVPRAGTYRVGFQTEDVDFGSINRDQAQYHKFALSEPNSQIQVDARYVKEDNDWGRMEIRVKEINGFSLGKAYDTLISRTGKWNVIGFHPVSSQIDTSGELGQLKEKSISFDLNKPFIMSSSKALTEVPVPGSAGATNLLSSPTPGPGLMIWFEEAPKEK